MKQTTEIESNQAVLGAMPDTKGLNFYTEDHNLQFLLRRYLSQEDVERAEIELSKLGDDAGNSLDFFSRVAEKNGPELVKYNAKGERIDEIEFNNAYKEMEKLGYSKYELVAMAHQENVQGWAGKFPLVLKYAFWYLFAQAEFSLLCPMSMTDSAARIVSKFASKEMKKQYLPKLTTTDMDEMWTGAQFMTEKQGGSDVGANSSTANQVDGEWRITGDKWFCSNPTADIILVLARPEGAEKGTRGLGMFLVPRRLENGELNNYTINRLKDKFGTKDMASGEITFDGAKAYVLGELSNGFKQMMEMVNSSRLSNAVRSTGLIRRGYLESKTYAKGRLAFGKPLSEQPLMVETIYEQLIDSEASTAMVIHTAQVYNDSENGDDEKYFLLRILTPILKGYICKRARYLSGEAMEARGGNGFIEDWVNPKLVRDAHVGSIWEGTTNILALDVIRASLRNQANELLFNDIMKRLSNIQNPLVNRVSELLKNIVEKTNSQTAKILEMEGEKREFSAKNLMNKLYHLTATSLLLLEADDMAEKQNNFRKLFVAITYLERYLLGDNASIMRISDEYLLEWFEDIVDWNEIQKESINPLVEEMEANYF